MPTVIDEKNILRQVTDYLSLRRIWYWRQNTGGMVKNYKRKSRFVRFGYPGTPDILGCWHGRMFGIEVKALNNQQSQAQIQFQAEMEAAGGKYILCYRLEDVQEYFEKRESKT